MATPTIVATGSVTAANSPGVSKEYVNLETLTFTDPANPAPTSALWELIDAPPGQTSAIQNPTTTTPTLVLDSDFGTFRVRHTADGDVGELLFAVLTTGAIAARIPGYVEQNDDRALATEGTWNKGGNIKGWFDDFHALLKGVLTNIITDHGELTGLADDDHTQYLLADGTRTVTGGFNINGATSIGGVLTCGTDLVMQGDDKHGDRTLVVSAAAASHFSSAGTMLAMEITGGFDWYGRFNANAVGNIIVFPISLRVGDRIQSIKYYYYGASAATKRFSFLINPCTTSLPTIQETNTSTSTGSTFYTQTVSPNITVAISNHYYAQFRTGASGDRIYSVEVTYDRP